MNVSHSSSRLSAVNTDEDWSLGNMSGGSYLLHRSPLLSQPPPSPPTLSLAGGINVEKVCSLSEGQRQEGHFEFFWEQLPNLFLDFPAGVSGARGSDVGAFRRLSRQLVLIFFFFALCWKPLSRKWVTQMSGAMSSFPPTDKKLASWISVLKEAARRKELGEPSTTNASRVVLVNHRGFMATKAATHLNGTFLFRKVNLEFFLKMKTHSANFI